MALSIASFAALRVNARYAILCGLTPRAKAVSTIFKSVVVFPIPGGPYIISTLSQNPPQLVDGTSSSSSS